MELSRTLDPLARWDQAEAAARRGLAVLEDSHPLRPHLLALAGRSAALQAHFSSADVLLEQALAAAGDDIAVGHVHHARGVSAFTRMAMRVAAEEFTSAAQLLHASGDRWEAAQAAVVARSSGSTAATSLRSVPWTQFWTMRSRSATTPRRSWRNGPLRSHGCCGQQS